MANSSIYNSLYGGKDKRGFRGGSNNDILKLFQEKQSFLALVFFNLVFQLGITYYFMSNPTYGVLVKKTMGLWGLIIICFIIIIVLALVPMPPYLKFILFTAFSYLLGLLLSMDKFYPAIVKSAIVSVMAIFGTMFAFGITLLASGISLNPKFGFILLAILFLLIIARIVNFFIPSQDIFKYLSIFTIFLFSIFIIYDTNTILQRNYAGDFITASMDYYLDILNIFVNIMNLQN